jgi:hypothetical protein
MAFSFTVVEVGGGFGLFSYPIHFYALGGNWQL